MSDDEMPELEDFTEQLKEIRKAKGIDQTNVPTELKIGVINEKNNNDSNNKKNVQIPITKVPSKEETQKSNEANNNKNNNSNNKKRDEDNFGCGLFKRGFLKRHNFSEDEPKKTNNNNLNKPNTEKEKEKEKEKKNEPIDLTHIKSNPGTTTKTNILNK